MLDPSIAEQISPSFNAKYSNIMPYTAILHKISFLRTFSLPHYDCQGMTGSQDQRSVLIGCGRGTWPKPWRKRRSFRRGSPRKERRWWEAGAPGLLMSLCSLAATGPWRRFYCILLKLNLCWDAIYIYWWYTGDMETLCLAKIATYFSETRHSWFAAGFQCSAYSALPV